MTNEILIHKLFLINEIFERKVKMSKTIDYNFLRGQGRVLAILKRKDMLSTKELAIILDISISAVNLLLTKLEKKGYIIKIPSREDKRILLIKITEKGLNYEIKSPVDYNIFNCFNDTEKREFDNYLNRLIVELRDDLRKENPEKFDENNLKRKNLIKKLFNVDEENLFDVM